MPPLPLHRPQPQGRAVGKPDSFTEYLAAWNEREPNAIRLHLDRSVTQDVIFVDPANQVYGNDAVEQMIRDARAKSPDANYMTASEIDGHNRRYRYRWEVHFDENTEVTGMDVTTVDAAGFIERIDGFFGDFGAPAEVRG